MSEGSLQDFFYPLSPRQTMVLTTLFLTGDGADDLHLFEFLPDDDIYLLQEKAEKLMELDPDKRAGVIALEVRRQVQFAELAGLEGIDATWLLAAVRGEHPLTIGIVLAQLGNESRRRIMAQLPDAVRARIPGKEEIAQIRPEVMRIVRSKFAANFVSMPAPPSGPSNFYFKDIALLDGRELIQLTRALGIEELATAFMAVGKRKLAELCTKLSRQSSSELLAAVKETEARDAMEMADANDFLKRIVAGLGADARLAKVEDFESELFQKAGLFRMAKAVSMERPAFIQQVAQRLPRSHGKLLRSYVFRATERAPLPEEWLRRLQDLVLLRVEKLAARGKVDPHYLKFVFCYWGDEDAEG